MTVTSPDDGTLTSAKSERRVILVVMLTVVTGVTDATAFVKLGNVFTSVMTGNLVLLGLAAGKGSLQPVVHVALALVAFVTGAMVGGRIAGHPSESDGPWPHRLTVALCLEVLLFAGFAVLWETSDMDPTGQVQLWMLMMCALALGVQSSATLRLGIPGLSTTYLTGTLTNVVHSAVHGKFGKDTTRGLTIIVALVSGAILGSALAHNAPAAMPVPQLAILTFVISSGLVLTRRHDRWRS
jgi:uncharacterized membrane protein YoaK (UPF0700 family)